MNKWKDLQGVFNIMNVMASLNTLQYHSCSFLSMHSSDLIYPLLVAANINLPLFFLGTNVGKNASCLAASVEISECFIKV